MFNDEIGWPQVGDVVRFKAEPHRKEWSVVLILENPVLSHTAPRPYFVLHLGGITKGRKQPFWIQANDPRFEMVVAVGNDDPPEETP